MSAPGGPPAPETAKPGGVTDQQATGIMAVFGGLALLPLLFLLFFHFGAGYLSYQKYGSMMWAVVDFIFAYFYYPYYAFFLAKDPSPQPMGMIGGMMKAFSGGRRRR